MPEEVKTILFQKPGFKPRTIKRSKKPMRKTRIRKQSKMPLAKLQRALWAKVRALAILKQKNQDGTIDCYTCGARDLQGNNCQLGHMIPKSVCGAFLRYDIRILKFQCSRCNIWCGGMGAEFVRNMIVREGQEYVDQIFRDKLRILSGKEAYIHYEYLLNKYDLELEILNAKG